MQRTYTLLAVLWLARLFGAETGGRQAPAYSPSSLVNAASNQSGALAPNTIATLYGADLAYLTRGLVPDDIRDGLLPTQFPSVGVRVYVAGSPAPLYFVSPRQVNLLIPSNVLTGPTQLFLALDGRAGPSISITLVSQSPALFLVDERNAVSTRTGDIVTLYATGLGETVVPTRPGEIAKAANRLARVDEFRLTLAGEQVPRSNILYVGLAPGFAGLYQINFQLPAGTRPDPEIQIAIGDAQSPSGVVLPLKGQ